MSNVEPGKAKAAGIVGILILITALVNIICGCIYAGMGAKDGSGLWSGFGVSALYVFVKRTIVPELYDKMVGGVEANEGARTQTRIRSTRKDQFACFGSLLTYLFVC